MTENDNDMLRRMLTGAEAIRQRQASDERAAPARPARPVQPPHAAEVRVSEEPVAPAWTQSALQRAHPVRQVPPARRTRHVRIDADMDAYSFGGLLFAEFSGFVLWGALWLVNGFFTALVVAQLVQWVVVGVNSFATTVLGFPLALALPAAVGWAIGVVVHLVIASIEIHLWRSGRRSTYPTIVAVGTIDVLTSALGLQALGRAWGLPVDGLPYVIAYTILAEAIAIFPERRMVEHALAIRRMVRRN